MESDGLSRSEASSPLRVRLLGPLAVSRDGEAVALPASRKVRALLAFLALSPGPVPRSRLCELLWDIPDDPRGELRWCLSKLRRLVDEPGRRRIGTEGDAVRIDLADCFVDALEVERALRPGIETLPPERLRALAALFAGTTLEGLEIDRSPAFDGWLAAQRRRFRACRIALLEQLAGRGPDDGTSEVLDAWLELAPFDRRVHEQLLQRLAGQGRLRDGEEHLAAALRLFGAENLDGAPLREAWRRARAGGSPPCALAAAPRPVEADGVPGAAAVPSRRASVAVMPFADLSPATGGRGGASDARGGASDALAHDVITRLAKLRSLFVIAQGTVFALHERRVGPEEAGRMLQVDYVVGGTVRRSGNRLTVDVELAETRTGRIVWTEGFDQLSDDTLLVLDVIGNRIVASVAGEIEAVERNRAVLKPPNSLDAWEAHHRGLWHMYRFNKTDNARARAFFEMSTRLDPTFARAHAGLSFTHWQNAFQGWGERETETDRAAAAAEQSLLADDRDPAAHWAMGRALWLRGRHDPSVRELEQSVGLSPNFAQGHYALAFVHSQSGDPEAAIASSDHSRALSPFDPLLFAMLASRAMALVSLRRFEEAAEWGVRAAARPNAHAHILGIAAFSLALAGRLDEAASHAATIRKALPGYRLSDFLAAFRFAPENEALFREGAKRIGMA